MSKYRYKASPSRDKKIFSRGAAMVHKKNLVVGPMRGGIRI